MKRTITIVGVWFVFAAAVYAASIGSIYENTPSSGGGDPTNGLASQAWVFSNSDTNGAANSVSNAVTSLGFVTASITNGLGGGSFSWSPVPNATNSVGVAGSLAYGSNYVYICVESNLWRRATLGGW
jgi:hypothetical protein